MTTVTFSLDMYDSMESPLEIDLEVFTDYVNANGLDFEGEFLSRVWNYMVYSCDMGTSQRFDPMVYRIVLDVEELPHYVDISLATENADGGWKALARELEAICTFADSRNWDDRGNEATLAYLSFLSYEGWACELITRKGINERMSTFYGIVDSRSEVVDYLVEEGVMDAVPDWVVHDEEKTAKEAECQGYFSTYSTGYRLAVWI